MTNLRMRGAEAGPTLILVAGLHGNEPAGVEACRRLFEWLGERTLERGEIAAFVGNPAALAARRRFLDRDLNRQWTPDAIAAAREQRERQGGSVSGMDHEAAALAELSAGLDEVLEAARGPLLALDLHTTSAEGVPFSIVSSGAGGLGFAEKLIVPAILGLAKVTPGTLAEHLAQRGCVSLAVEGGQHASPDADANLEALLTLALVACGLATDEPARTSEARELLFGARGDLPPSIEVVSRHVLQRGSDFRMERGFGNIQRVTRGTLLAREHGVEILAPGDGFVLLPLYQEQGEDGFFFGKALRD